MKDLGGELSGRPERHVGLWLMGGAVLLAAGLWVSGAGGQLAAVLTHGVASVNRTLPEAPPPAPVLSFSASPTDAEFLHAGLFAEPLVPTAATMPAENRELAKAVLAYRDRAGNGATPDAVGPLLDFLAAHADSPWQAALQLNLGIIYRQTGHFSKALAVWQDAWRNTEKLTDRNGRALGDATIARLTQFEAYLGRKEVLQPLLDTVRDRPVRGSASQVLTSSREGLFHMIARPERSFKCGPIALSRILLHDNPTPAPAVMQVFEEARSTPNGMSLAAVQQVSVEAGMNYQMAYRTRGAPIITPAVAHWNVGHYAAIENSDTDRFIVEDPTFGETIRVSAATLDDESSGYFLVPQGRLPAGWRSVGAAEGGTIWGRGDTGNNKDPGDTGPHHHGPHRGPHHGPHKPPHHNPHGCKKGGGCTAWDVAPMVVGLELEDVPVGYSPPLGPDVDFDLYYSHRDVLQPQTFSYVNFGPKWTFNWLSYVTDAVTTNASASVYQRGGGSEPFTFASTSATVSAPGPFSQTTLKRSVGPLGASTGFTRQLPDGSSEQFNLAVGHQFFMTAVVDQFGNKVVLHYDSQMRIIALTDGIGQVSTLTYGLASDPLKVTKITDPFGRSAIFTYNAAGQLASITDTLGITSSYTYGTADFISSLKTPYGTTTFSYGDATTNPSLGDTVFLKVTDPLNRTSYYEFNQLTTPIDANNAAPTGMVTCVCYLQFRNTFMFDPNEYQNATAAGGLDYSKGHLIHWLHTSDLSSTARVIESEKEPLESRVWYNYPGQPSSIQFGTSASGVSAPGTSSMPTAIGQVLDNGTTQVETFQYNAFGNPTLGTDPVGRQTSYAYAPNGIDLVSITNTTSGSSQLLASFTYNAFHEPLSITGANGVASQYQYNAAGQLTQITDQLGYVTTLSYADGYLKAVQGPTANAALAFTYDAVGRVSGVTDEAGATVSYAYDAADRPTVATFPDGTTTKYAYNLLDLVTSTDRLGRTTTMSYDAERELTKVVDPTGAAMTFGYSPAGLLRTITDPNDHTTILALDGESRIVAKRYADGSVQQTTYEKNTSRVAQVTDALGQTTSYTYNVDDSLASIAYGNALKPTPGVSFSYDPVFDRPLTMTDGTGTTTYAYYPVTSSPVLGANQLKSVTSPVAGAAALSDTVVYSYDALDRIVGRSVNGAAQTTGFDSLGRTSTVTNPLDAFVYSYSDATERVTGLSSSHGPNVALSYFGPTGDELLQQITYTSRGGTTLSQFAYTYDTDDNVQSFTESYLNQNPALIAAIGGPQSAAGSMIRAALQAGGIPVASSLALSRLSATPLDAFAAVLIVSIVCLLGWMAYGSSRSRFAWAALPAAMAAIVVGCSGGSGSGAASSPGTASVASSLDRLHPPTSGQVSTYAYDLANRLVSSTITSVGGGVGTSPQFTYAYDRASNPTSIAANGAAQSLAYSATNELASAAYDANGNRTAFGKAQYAWDASSRILNFSSGTTKSQFIYDGLGRLVRIIDQQGGVVVADHAYFWCGVERCLEHDNTQNGSPVSKQYFDEGVLVGSTPYYYVTDELGSVRQLVNASGQVEAQYDYDPYGNQIKVSGAVDADFGYAGYFHHKPSGLDFAVFRAYDPGTASWLNRDPSGEEGGFNLYGYVDANPTGSLDPLGLKASSAVHGKHVTTKVGIARHTHKADRGHKTSWHKAVHHASKSKASKHGKCPVVLRDAVVDKGGKTDKQVTADAAAVLGRAFVDGQSDGSSTWYADAGGFTAAHASNLTGADDEYADDTDDAETASVPAPGWNGNVLASFSGSADGRFIDALAGALTGGASGKKCCGK
jgi:RHS repeat-associated protein